MASVKREGFGSMLKRRVTAVKTEVTTEYLAAMEVVRTDVVEEARAEATTQVAGVRAQVLAVVEQAGTSGGVSLGKYNQSFPAASVWIVNHNLGRPVAVRVTGAGGQEVIAEVNYVSDNQARVSFDCPTPGSVSVT